MKKLDLRNYTWEKKIVIKRKSNEAILASSREWSNYSRENKNLSHIHFGLRNSMGD